MTNWHYYDTDGEKKSVTSKEFKQLALTGAITRGTLIEDPGGRTSLAKNVKGLKFPEAVQPKPTPETISPEPEPLASVPVAPVEAKPVAPTTLEYYFDDGGDAGGGGDYFDDGNHRYDTPYDGSPRVGRWELIKAIRDEPDQRLKKEMLRDYEFQFGQMDRLTKGQIGIDGY